MKSRVLPLITFLFISACALNTRPVLSEQEMTELWQNPVDLAKRDLLWGPGGKALAPDAKGSYSLVEVDKTGFSPGYDVRDDRGRLWKVKLGPEAQSEVVVSRLLWSVGYHQPAAIYYLPGWTLSDKGRTTSQPGARFRLELETQKDMGDWSWRDNPFLGTRPFEGLFVFMVMVNNWDLKATNNTVYRVQSDGGGPRSIYVVKDLGGSLGKTAWPFPGTRNDLEGFAREPFIDRVAGNRVTFHYQGAWREPHLVASVTPADVRWMCDLLARLSPQQWNEAFRAGGYTETEASRYIERLRQKIAEGQNIG